MLVIVKYLRCVDWAGNGSLFATCSSDKTVKLWNPITLEQKKLLLGHSNWVRWVKFTFDSKRLLSGGDDSFIILWSIPEGQILQRIVNLRKTISAACFLNAPG
ncbi:WD40-repeat-containing domain protein, partial [Baffinella frigidus]